MKYTHLLIDGRNALYRAVYAGMGDKTFRESGSDYFAIFIRFIHHYYSTFSPRHVHIFWDPPRDDVWRNDVLPEYKGNRGKNDEIAHTIKRQFVIALDVCRSMGMRQYYRDRQEADDLIYAFCRSVREPTIVVSSDSDLIQLPYSFSHVDLYNPTAKAGRKSRRDVKLESIPIYDPVIVKALTGDKTDNIGGYHKIGPVKAKHLASHLKELHAFLGSNKAVIQEDGETKPVHKDVFRRNRILIDLSLCPELLDNMMYIEESMVSNVKYDHRKIIEKLRDRSVTGVIEEASKYIMPFARISKE